jgi:hypothetical protein
MRYYGLKIFLSVLTLSAAARACMAQGASDSTRRWQGFGIEANIIAGKVFKHEAKFTLPIPALTTGLNINLVKHSYGKKTWEQRRRYPTFGIGFTYINYGIDSIYGRCFGIYPELVLPLISGKKLEWTLTPGDGLGYVSRQYSRVAPVDTTNVAIGYKLNDFVTIATALKYHVNAHWDIQLGANATHISNGSYKKPNLGINMAGVHAGVTYYPVTSKAVRINRNLRPLPGRWLLQARLSMSMVSSNAPGGPLYPVYIATAYASKRWHSHNKFFAGVDYSYHEDIYALLRNNGFEEGRESQYAYKSAVVAGNEFLLGRLGIVLQMGAYVRQAYYRKDPVYEKVGAQYYIVQREQGPLKELFLSVFLKTHQNVAEFAEFGVGAGF